VDRSEALLSIAEIALGLAGFGGIFVALSRERDRPRRPADTYRLVLLMSTALSTLVLALLPAGLIAVGVVESWVWPLASGAMTALITTLIGVTWRFRREHREEIRAGEFSRVAGFIWVVAVAMLAAQVGNALGLFAERSFGVFLLGLVFLVAFGAYLFARMLFLWRS
jgi:peptidoglycan/LPS O-acetylase OafA/YrhL